VIIGRREEGESKDVGGGEQVAAENGAGVYTPEDEALLDGEEVELDEDLEERKRREDILQLDLEEEESGKSGRTPL